MSERSFLDPEDLEFLLKEYGVTEFHLDLVRFCGVTNCLEAEDGWKPSWPFCPVCGGERDSKGLVQHKDMTVLSGH